MESDGMEYVYTGDTHLYDINGLKRKPFNARLHRFLIGKLMKIKYMLARQN